MLVNYIKTICRNVVKTKGYSLINILGLAVGMAAFLLLMFFIRFERSYDRFHPDYERIYRLRYERTTEDGQAVRFASCCPPAGARIRERIPEVEKVGRLCRQRAVVSYEDIVFREERMYFAEPEVLEILPFPFLEGDPLRGLNKPNTAYVSRSAARKYFGDANPVGKILSMDRQIDFTVAGIFEDLPHNSHLKFDILLAFPNLVSLLGPDYTEAWGHTGMYTYLRLRPGTDLAALEAKLSQLVQDEFGQVLKSYRMTMTLPLQSLQHIHLDSHFMQEYEANGSRNVVDTLFYIALFIIVVAWVNYVNLSTARSLTRAREVGLRKVVGASRRQIISQFFLETSVLHLAAVLAALFLLTLLVEPFSSLTGTSPDFPVWSAAWFWITVVLLFSAGILFSGIYPVLAMSSFRPITILQGRLGTSVMGIGLRRLLVVFQFVVAIVLLSGTLTVFRQIHYMRGRDLGFDIEQILAVKAPRVRDKTYGEKWKTFKEILLQRTDVPKMCHVTEVPGRQILWDAGAIRRAGEDPSKGKNYQIVGVDYDFVNVFDLELVCGRSFSREYTADAQALLLNETAVRSMGFENSRSALDQQVDYWGEFFTVIGVLKDYHQQSPKQAYEPHLYRLMPLGRDVRGMFALKLRSADLRNTLDAVKKTFDGLFPGNPFEFFFLDEYFDQQYRTDSLFGRVVGLFSGLGLFITALGLFGLSSFTVFQRTKEIGIRKVMGAGTMRIIGLLSREFFRLVMLAFVFALPLMMAGTNTFLVQYASRIKPGPGMFLWPLLVVILVTFFTVSRHVMRAAAAEPADVLRSE
jgi:putative ABC transport system permease protein